MWIAIDPGAKGGIAIGTDPVQVYNMPKTPTDIFALLDNISTEKCKILIEKTGTYRPGNSGPSAVKFGRHCGVLEGICIGLRVPFYSVPPGKWMKSLGSLPKEKGDRKRSIKEEMQRRFPHLKVTLVNADALGLLTYAQNYL